MITDEPEEESEYLSKGQKRGNSKGSKTNKFVREEDENLQTNHTFLPLIHNNREKKDFSNTQMSFYSRSLHYTKVGKAIGMFNFLRVIWTQRAGPNSINTTTKRPKSNSLDTKAEQDLNRLIPQTSSTKSDEPFPGHLDT